MGPVCYILKKCKITWLTAGTSYYKRIDWCCIYTSFLRATAAEVRARGGNVLTSSTLSGFALEDGANFIEHLAVLLQHLTEIHELACFIIMIA